MTLFSETLRRNESHEEASVFVRVVNVDVVFHDCCATGPGSAAADVLV
jgi:hypothetical protein